MRTADIDTTGELWAYRPQRHKTLYRGHDRVIYLGERAKELIRPFLKPDLTAFLFSPTEAEAARRAAVHAARRTPLGYGNSPGTNREKKPRRQPGKQYDTHSYRRAVQAACEKAFPIPPEIGEALNEKDAQTKRREWRRQHRWHPHQLRHNHATAVRRQFGIEAVQAALGQKSVSAAQVYGEKSAELAQKIAASIG
jgi:integrase